MKKLKILLAPILLVFMLFSCSSDDKQENVSNDVNKTLGLSGKITVTGKLHRGDRWSNKRNVPPCTMSFGLCHVDVSIEVTIPIGPNPNPSPGYQNINLELVRADVLRISFDRLVEIPEDGFFFSKEENPFVFPDKIAEHFNLQRMILIPDNYIVKQDNPEQYPFGYVDVNLMVR